MPKESHVAARLYDALAIARSREDRLLVYLIEMALLEEKRLSVAGA